MFKSFINKMSELIKRKKILRSINKRFYSLEPTPKVLSVVPESIKKENVDLRANIVVLQSKIAKLAKQLKDYDEKVDIDSNIINQRKELIDDNKKRTIDLGLIIEQVKKGKEIKVFSNDMKFLGNLKTFSLDKEKLIGIVCEYGGRDYIIAKGPSIDYLVSHSENISDQLNKGVLKLNKYYNGYTIPDIELPVDEDELLSDKEAQTIAYESAYKKIKELKSRLNKYYQDLEHLQKLNIKLINENKDLRMSSELNKSRADSSEASFVNVLESLKEYINHINSLSIDQGKLVASSALAEESEKHHQEVANKAIDKLSQERLKNDFDVGLNNIQRSIETIAKAKNLIKSDKGEVIEAKPIT